nr:DUF3604 domain-containing protein [Chloroflexota bacterium]
MTEPLTLYWGDIHNHNEIGYGRGSLERSYRLAQNTLDFYAFTPHGWWPDMPEQDEALCKAHREAFERVQEHWPEVIAQANAANRDGTFVSYIGYEWHSLNWGDYHIIFPDSFGQLFHAPDLASLLKFARENGALAIPHHSAYKQGWRGTKWAEHDEQISPVCEIYSEHGNSFETPSYWGMYAHSMGGSNRSQTVIEQLKIGRIIGFTAGTDNHFGYPGSYAEGLTGVWASQLTRQAIFDALRRRHSYAITGDRIKIWFALGTGIMGDVLPASVSREIRLEIEALDEIDYVELNKNGYALARWWGDRSNITGSTQHLLRLEWGWDALSSVHLTTWEIQGELQGGRLMRMIPCLAGGGASTDRVNLMHVLDATHFIVESYTSRMNPLPTNSVVLEVEASQECQLALVIFGQHPKGGAFRVSCDVVLNQLRDNNVSLSVFDSFLAPKVRIGPVIEKDKVSLVSEFVDPNPGDKDFYFIKVVQKNGHLAWSSPIWCNENRN